MNKKIIHSSVAMLSTIIILLVVCSQFEGIAFCQQYPQQYAAGDNIGDTYQQAPPSAGTVESPVIQGLEGLKGFGSGHNQLSLAVIPLSRQDNQMTFQVIGFAVSSPESGQAVIYSFKTPLPGVIDPSRNTMQINIANIDSAINTVGYIDSSQVYDTIRTDPKVVIIDFDLTYQGKQDSQTIFNVNRVDIIPPDGKMQTFSMQQPTQLIVDKQSDRVSMVAFPEMVDTIDSYYGVTYPQVEPVVYSEPVPVLAPLFVPYIQPLPIFISGGFVGFNSFFFGTGFRPFFDRDRFTGRDRFTDRDRFPVRQARNNFANRARNDLVNGQRRGEFTGSRNLGSGVRGGIGGFRGGTRAGMGGRAGGRVGGRGGGGRRR